ncbi:hypothetical protein [Candidatus Contubernalis alkaliaceticus]|uniref:hypothetical protein n=1 Tax=Candidatus Contubernalis alkaliaceticus TaxID=338645 RepID=UPI001F4C21F2|nr:hypothetical protein [Candidatus Contubernalis alkalaceticus]UNC91033.1 hypothetical protein HUE98_02405 [Candidatus Contubernalis alkalaceticus]
MLWTMSKFEFKNLVRDRMTAVMILYPLILGGLGKYLIDNQLVEGQALGVIAMMVSLMVGFAYGAMAGFSLLDDRDDQVLTSIQISPIPLAFYLWFKIVFVYIIAVLAGFFLMWFIGDFALFAGEILLVSMLSSLQVPIVAFLVNAFAKNKIEGFITMKASGFLLLLPIGSFFFLDAKEWLFSLAPGHWAGKALQYSLMRPLIDSGFLEMNLNFYQYVGIGFLYNIFLITVIYRFFIQKNHF